MLTYSTLPDGRAIVYCDHYVIAIVKNIARAIQLIEGGAA